MNGMIGWVMGDVVGKISSPAEGPGDRSSLADEKDKCQTVQSGRASDRVHCTSGKRNDTSLDNGVCFTD